MSNYIYKMFDKNNKIIYIGKTIDIDQRIRQHMMDKDKNWFKTVSKIYYAECLNKTDMDVYEIYYINKLVPLHNKQSANGCEFSQELNELNFVESGFNVKLELSKVNKKNKKKSRQEKELIQSKFHYEEINEFTQYYNVGERYLENEEILKLYKDKINAKDFLKLLNGLQFLVNNEDPCTLYYYQDTEDICNYNDISFSLISFSSKQYHYTVEEFINNLSNNIITPLKYLSNEDIKEINSLRINEYGLFNNMAVINKLESKEVSQ